VDAVRDTLGRNQEIARLHLQLAPLEQKSASPFEHVVDLVLTGMRVQRMLLAGLERVDADQQARFRKSSPCPSSAASTQRAPTGE
jgi:hypothetical protein